ncbi:hypothetical protein BU17DRAFT_87737 [Hysterangium stoloniferum]|nr:hypothetical protein BU17DRAFT_87737 [Hysterangium stoloniferum]
MLQPVATTLAPPLVQLYDRISDLEDNIHITSSAQRAATLQISALELKRTQHLAALNTGLLVEKTHVTSELNRLMERATEEAARRGVAESAQQEIERDLDGLSAELFGKANAMVAEARIAAAKEQMQVLQAEKERADRAMDKGKWVERDAVVAPSLPPIATLLPLPFLTCLVAEDSDPTLRLDAAPALNWLTRRTVTAAIHTVQLTIEPLPANAILQTSSSDPHCALCGKSASNGPTSWRPAFLKNQNQNSSSQGQSHSIHSPTPPIATSASFYPPSTSTPPSCLPLQPPPSPQYRLRTRTCLPLRFTYSVFKHPPRVHNPFLALHKFNTTSSTYYTLCNSGWCFSRLRMTCELWRFVRVGIVGSVWEEVPTPSPPPQHPQTTAAIRTASSSISSSPTSTSPKPPAVPPRRRVGMGMNMSIGKLFGMALGKGAVNGTATSTTPTSTSSPLTPLPTRSGSIASGMLPPPLPRRSETRERMSFGLGLGEKDKSSSIASPIQRVTPLFLDTKSSASAVKPDVEANPASLTKPPQGLTTSEHIKAKNTKPPVQDKGTGENTNTKLEASEIPPATPVRASTSTTTTDAEPSTAVVCPTASVIPIATATAAASEEGQNLSRTSSPAPLPPPPPPVPRRAAKRAVPVVPAQALLQRIGRSHWI